MRSVTGTKRQARADNNQIYTLFGSSKIYLELFELGRNLGSLIVGLKPNGVFAPKEYLSPCSSEILGTFVLLELFCVFGGIFHLARQQCSGSIKVYHISFKHTFDEQNLYTT